MRYYPRNKQITYISFLFELFRRQLVQKQRFGIDFRTGKVAGLATVDEDVVGVLLELGEVFVEVGVVEGDAWALVLLGFVGVFVELGLAQLDKHLLQQRLHLIQHPLEVLHLFLLVRNILLNLNPLLLLIRRATQYPLLLLILFLQCLILQSQCLVSIDESIYFLVEDIDVGE